MKQLFSLRRFIFTSVTGFLTVVIVCFAMPSLAKKTELTPAEAQKIATDAYIYGYALVTSEVTRLAFINTVEPNPKTFQAPMGQLVNIPEYPPANYKGVTAPNADTLYSAAFVDISQEPWVLSYPNMGDRFFLFPIYSEWTEVIASPGSRTLGNAAQNILITGPAWHGKVPAGMMQVKSPTGIVFLIGRTYSSGTMADLDAVHALQAQYKLVPLSSFGKPYTAPAGATDGPYSIKDKVRDLIAAMSTSDYFNFMTKTMQTSPAVLPQDAAIVADMAKLGIIPGKPFDLSALPLATQKALENIGKIAFDKIAPLQTKGGKLAHGWMIPNACGTYGKAYLQRAAIAAYGWGCNLQKDAVYPLAKVDANGKPFMGSNTYVIHFAKGELPPVSAFWSITMYDTEFFFYPNPLNKLTESMRDHPKMNADGSMDLYFSHVQPANVDQANWLPAPEGQFILMMRLYWPKATTPSILNGTWAPPAVHLQS